jgi:hypothetical protein
LNALNFKKETPLDIAIAGGSEGKFTFLMLHGVKPTGAQLLKAKEKDLNCQRNTNYHPSISTYGMLICCQIPSILVSISELKFNN